MSELYACVCLRELPAQALLRLRPALREMPVAVMGGDPPTESVCSLNRPARRIGINLGMSRVELDTFEAVTVFSRSSKEEESTRAALLECAGGFSPRVEAMERGTMFFAVMDIAGTERLLGAPANLVRTLVDRIRKLGLAPAIAVSKNLHTALCLARAGRSILCAAGEEARSLARLPISVLDLSRHQADTFAAWGISSLGAIAALPEKELIARMGQEGKQLRQLACGEMPHLFLPIEPAFMLREYLELDTPVEILDSLLFVLGMMLEQLIVRASERVLALASVTVRLTLEQNGAHERTVRPALPSHDRRLWLKLLQLDLEAHGPSAAVLDITLEAEPGSTSKVQLGLFSPQLPEPSRLDVTLARIRAIVGEDCVGRAVLSDTHRPDSSRIEPFRLTASSAPMLPVAQKDPTAIRMLRPAEAITVILRERVPAAMIFRGERYQMERAYGPWLMSGSWWDESRWNLEQWDLIARSPQGVMLSCVVLHNPTLNLWQMAMLYD